MDLNRLLFFCIYLQYQILLKMHNNYGLQVNLFSITPALYTLPAFVRKFTNNNCKKNMYLSILKKL